MAKLENAIGEVIAAEISWRRDIFEGRCESPIEVEMLTALWAVGKYEAETDVDVRAPDRITGVDDIEFSESAKVEIAVHSEWKKRIDVVPQMHLGKYRVDLALMYRGSEYVCSQKFGDLNRVAHAYVYLPTIIIECDGHDYHERTKEQAARDKARDRELQQTGNPVLRFTGSEIYRDSYACAKQVYTFISAASERASKAYIESELVGVES